MTWTKLLPRTIKLTFAINLSLGFVPVLAQVNESIVVVQHQEFITKYHQIFAQSSSPPEEQGAPVGTKPGGSRGCGDKQLVPLVLVDKQPEDRELRWGFTTKENPTFWVYVPYEAEFITAGKFKLLNRAGDIVYETNLTITETSGVLSISIPSAKIRLENNKWYHWYLYMDVYCTPTSPAQKNFVDGWIKRQELNAILKTQLEQETPQQRAIIQAENGFFYDALMTLAESENTPQKSEHWAQLLRSHNLEAISNVPLVDCCTPEKQ
ncbi:MAG: DUF928 domain-containing protein [Symploca sp. SIO3E6]|nr:DUF928 domain-containing protein [Caldora sp. SIO3E6]